MDYFRILNLNREPFSNSPEPEFFFPSAKHLACLQQLELAIRLRRGLNVVMGDVGTGKTTLCRELILRFTESEEDRNDVQTHLLLDPSFSSPREFLSTVAISFGLAVDASQSEWQLKEGIKNDLFRKGVDEKKTVVLIIDEGQKLPAFCLEILREFLNYETNENKLLQIIIFAQNEFTQILNAHANFADRVNQCYLLKPLNFQEMKAMIRFRLAQAGQPEEMGGAFTLPGLWAVYRATGGYPRKVVTLCHQVMLSLIIQNRSSAGWSLVRSCATRLPAYHVGKWKPATVKWVTASAATAVLAFFVVGLFASGRVTLGNPFTFFQKTETPSVSIAGVKPVPPLETQTPPSPVSVPPVAHVATPPVVDVKPVDVKVPDAVAQTRTEPQKPMGKRPDILGKLTIRKGGTVFWALKRVYENFNFDGRQVQVIRKINPHIKDINKVRADDEVVNIPAFPVTSNPLPVEKGLVWVQIARSHRLEEMYNTLLNHPKRLPSVRLFSYWNGREGLVFMVLLRGDFTDESSAQNAIRQLPPSMAAGATVIKNWDKGTVFFANNWKFTDQKEWNV